MTKRFRFVTAAAVAFLFAFASATASAQLTSPNFSIRKVSANEFDDFNIIFGEMRGPLRSEMMKDRKTDFEKADPLKYLQKIKGDRGVKKILKKKGLSWEKFEELTANVLLAYFSIQPGKTKAALIRQLADYGLMMDVEGIPEEARPLIAEALKTEEGAGLAGMALEMFIQIPPENLELARKNERTLDRAFYTKFWKNKI
ncbi:MAG TPA: hypothetical protein PLZ86_07765 [bacterium]|nr:hypothetical protein [bacterium]